MKKSIEVCIKMSHKEKHKKTNADVVLFTQFQLTLPMLNVEHNLN